MTEAMLGLAGGDETIHVPGAAPEGRDRRNGRGRPVFKEHMIEASRLREEQKNTEARIAEERKAGMRRLVAEFRAAVGGIVNVVSTASTELEGTAATLSQSAERNRNLSATVATASGNPRQMFCRSHRHRRNCRRRSTKLAGRCRESSKIASEAVTQARLTGTRIGELLQAVHSIGGVVKLIAGIANRPTSSLSTPPSRRRGRARREGALRLSPRK